MRNGHNERKTASPPAGCGEAKNHREAPLSPDAAKAWLDDATRQGTDTPLVLLDGDLDAELIEALLAAERIIQIGAGIYAAARRARFFDRGLIPTGEFSELVRAVAKRFGRDIVPCPETLSYNAGLSTQIPTGRYNEMSGPPLRIELRWGSEGALIELVAPGDR